GDASRNSGRAHEWTRHRGNSRSRERRGRKQYPIDVALDLRRHHGVLQDGAPVEGDKAVVVPDQAELSRVADEQADFVASIPDTAGDDVVARGHRAQKGLEAVRVELVL